MNRFKIVLAYLVFILAVGCGTQKKYTRVESQKSDTIIIKTEAVRAPVLNDLLTIDDICQDSVVRVLDRVLVRDTDTIRISTVDNSLSVRISQQERTLSERELTIRKLQERLSEKSEVVKTKTSLKTILIFSAIILLFLVFPGIPTWIHKFVRSLLPI